MLNVFRFGLAGNGWLTLLNPVMFNRIGENTLHIFGAINFLSIPLIWAFYPETANRTLEEMDYLFMSKSPFVWDEEANFKRMKEEAERNRAQGKVPLPDSEAEAGEDEKTASRPTEVENAPEKI